VMEGGPNRNQVADLNSLPTAMGLLVESQEAMGTMNAFDDPHERKKRATAQAKPGIRRHNAKIFQLESKAKKKNKDAWGVLTAESFNKQTKADKEPAFYDRDRDMIGGDLKQSKDPKQLSFY
jgi:hypothetical protein